MGVIAGPANGLSDFRVQSMHCHAVSGALPCSVRPCEEDPHDEMMQTRADMAKRLRLTALLLHAVIAQSLQRHGAFRRAGARCCLRVLLCTLLFYFL